MTEGSEVGVPVRSTIFNFFHTIQTGSEVHEAYPMDTGVISPEVKWQEREAHH
jgi:hypothetical protein